MKQSTRRHRIVSWLVAAAGLLWASVASASISGTVVNGSLWRENIVAPPGNGDGIGQLRVRLQLTDGTLLPGVVLTNGVLPLPTGPYDYSLGGSSLTAGTYVVFAWVDGNGDSLHDEGEPYGLAEVAVPDGVDVLKVRVTVKDDGNDDGLPDWWQYHWFLYAADPFAFGSGSDPDGDGMSNLDEYRLSVDGYGLDYLSPANWDTDGDGLDDGYECRYFDRDAMTGMNPVSNDATNDFDGDGLSNFQEYCGVDGLPRMEFDEVANGVTKGRVVPGAPDDLNPLDIDSDYDMLLDSFEAAWYDPVNGIDPHAGVLASVPTNGVTIDTRIAEADSDRDGLSNFREQCLLQQLNQASTNYWMWDWSGRVPFVQDEYIFNGKIYRICTMTMCGGAPLDLSLAPGETIPASTNRVHKLREHEWTDPTEGTGYDYVDEDIPPGHDTDDDDLPDGWEVEFNLDPRDNGFGATWDNGPFGDPDNDGLMNIEEYYGQDGDRLTTLPYVNGTGDETNPNEHNWRPDSTYEWRWLNPTDIISGMGLPRDGTGISRRETLGSALPTQRLPGVAADGKIGTDGGADSDDDGIPDAQEIFPDGPTLATSPMDSSDPFIRRSALIISSNGIPIPDPEPAVTNGVRPSGWREDLQRRDWTLECQVKLLGTNLTGNLFDFETQYGPKPCIVYRLALSNNAPVVVSANSAMKSVVVSGNALPTNRWVHLAAVWDHVNNSLCLYIDGVLNMSPMPLGESFSRNMYPATNSVVLASSPNGSFVNQLELDEVRIWGLARTAAQIAAYSKKLAPAVNGDDVWVHNADNTDSIIVNGGNLFSGEAGIPMANVCVKDGSYWIDNGDNRYYQMQDTLLYKGSNLMEGVTGTAAANVLWKDRDDSGDFTRNILLAYYRFDDGGSSAEDFVRKAKNGLVGAVNEEYRFGDRGYALPTNNFLFVTNDAAPVYGVDQRGADDSDHDGLPDAWEIIHGLDPWEDGTRGETTEGAKDGPNGALGDPDGDGLVNRYEYWSGTNPRFAESDGNGILDSQEDRDGDGVVNIAEQLLGSRPDIVDTDDDGFTDSEEQGTGTSPINATDPAISRAVSFSGGAGDYLDVPVNIKQRLSDWTLESWVMPSNAVDGAGIIVRRVVETMAGGTQAVNYVMGLEPNGAGGLRLYAGYLWPDGRQFMVRGGTVAPATWSHVAASYSSLSATLTLYTNGVASASTNTFYLAPPVSGRGGDTFLRIGEDFAGVIDEVRLWKTVRTLSQIQANTNKVISVTDTNGLIGYFRFDDGEANTNLVGWSEFHQSAGYQDFTYGDDWNAMWQHAAVRLGNVAGVMPGAIVPPPSLRVILQPEDAVLAGAQWCLDGGAWQASSASLPGLTPGTHTVIYKSILGWTKPASETITLTNGVATTFIRTYIQQATLVVRFDDLSTPAAAAWRVNGGAWLDSGTVVSNLNAGDNVISYQEVAGWFEPPNETVTLTPGMTTELMREYTVMTTAVSVIVMPTNAAALGAQWRVDGGVWRLSGEVAGGLSLSTHQIEFSNLSRWIAPATVNVTPTNELTYVVTGRYTQVTGLAVDITPVSAIATGALWRLSGGNWTNSGTLLEVGPGTYTVEFKPVGSGWIVPGSQTAIVVNEQVTVVNGVYYQADVFGGSVSTNAGEFYHPSGLDLDPRHRLYVADMLNDRVQMFDPLTQGWTVMGGRGTAIGQFMSPAGVAVDGVGNIYVADQGNHRIQKRVATNSQWVVLGSNTLSSGSALGQFFSPADVAVDSARNLYVADTWNHRVQRLGTSGVWSVFVTNGVANGKVQYPQGLTVDGTDNLYVSDDGLVANGQNRVQKFTKTGTLLSQLGGYDASLGGLRYPSGLSLGGNSLYAADISDSRVAVLDLTGMTWTTMAGSNVLNRPADVEWDPRGYLYIADTWNNRILMVVVDPAAVTNGVTQLAAMSSPGTNTAFTLSWFGRLNWNYAVQYSPLLLPANWLTLPGCTNIVGMDMMTNVTDNAVLGVTNRFYRIIAY